MKGLLVGIRVLNRAPSSWGAMERVCLDSHDRARKLTWNHQHGELSLWRPLFSLKHVVCVFLGKTHGKTIIWSTIWGEDAYTFWSTVNLNEQWKNCFFCHCAGSFSTRGSFGITISTYFWGVQCFKSLRICVFCPLTKCWTCGCKFLAIPYNWGWFVGVLGWNISFTPREAHDWRGHHALLEGCTCKPCNEQATPVESEGS